MFLRFAALKNINLVTKIPRSESIRNVFNVKRITSDAHKQAGKPDIYQVTTDTHKETDLKKFKTKLDSFGIFSVFDKTKEPALLIVKHKEAFSFEEVITFAAKLSKK